MTQITCPHCADTYPDFDAAHVCSKGPYAPRLKSKMNPRIKLLAEQAGYDWQWDTQIDFGHKEMEKFAELIVQECAKVADGGWADPGHQIKQHFGVER